MGGISFSIRSYLDNLIEIVSIKSGLILTYDEVRSFLKEKYNDWFLEEQDIDKGMHIRSETFDAHASFLRIKMGNITPAMENPHLFSRNLTKWIKMGYNPVEALEVIADYSSKHPGQVADPDVVVLEIIRKTRYPKEMAIEVVKDLMHAQESSNFIHPTYKRDWKDGTPLSDLFNCEIKGAGDQFIPQKFLDYLAVNQDKLEAMHWRNFERFCAEFFARLNYYVELGPGTNDGGIDIRAYDKNDTDKPIIVIQCKRHKKNNKVKIEVVKAFYTDVSFDEAKHGIIITTSYIEPGGKAISSARQYPLSFVENEQVKEIAAAMWRYHKTI